MESFYDIWQYMPHGMCLLWQPWLVVLWAGSDTLIFLAYMAIPLSLLRVVRGRDDIQHRGLILLFAGFILLCGLTHLLGVVTLWWPIYPYVGMVKLATGLVSALTAIVLFRLIPTLISIPGYSQLEKVNEQLREKVVEYEAAQAELLRTKAELEEKVLERTAALKSANGNLAVVAREAVHRSKNLLTIVTSVARQSAKGETDIDAYLKVLLGRISALSDATATVIGDGFSTSAEFGEIVRNQIKPLVMTFGDRIQIEGPALDVNAEAAQQISLALHELAANAQKHGSLSTAEGSVSISWHEEEEDAKEQVVFEWSESHAGKSDSIQSEREGFGVKLLMIVVPGMLRGTAQRMIVGDRLVYELRFPMKSLVADASVGEGAAAAARIVKADFGIS